MKELSLASQTVLNFAAWEASALGSACIEIEHIMIGLLKSEDILKFERKADNDIEPIEWESLMAEAEKFQKTIDKQGITSKSFRRSLRSLLVKGNKKKENFTGHRSKQCKDMYNLAEKICQDNKADSVSLMHTLMAVLAMNSPYIEQVMREFSLDSGQILENLDFRKKRVSDEQKLTPFLDKFGRDLSKMARDGGFDPVIGRREEMRKLARILLQKRKNNPMLIGEAGVGKTCIVEGLAQRAASPDALPEIRNFRIIEISMGTLISNTKYRGEFEERLENIIKEAEANQNIVLFIDEIHTIVKGEASEAANILKPALARRSLKCIGATTIAEYRKYFEKDAALERRFQPIWVEEPDKEQAVIILKGLKHKYEEYHGIKIPDRVIEKAVELSIRYLPDYRLPDKAIDLIDQACAAQLLKTLSPSGIKKRASKLEIEDVARLLSERCRIPVESLTIEEGERLLKMEEYLGKRVMGQEHVIKEVAEVIRSGRAGIRNPSKPLGVFLFLGSTGTGKTELAKALAEFLFNDEKNLITIDMSEYQEKHNVSRLIGAPPGYIGYEEEGVLTGKVRTKPYSVVLFDEIEKAHPSVMDIFLQIFDEGRLTDSHGRKVSFSECIVILTSNLGSSLKNQAAKRPIGFEVKGIKNIDAEASEDKLKSYIETIDAAVKSAIRPEIINRIQRKLIFHPLSKDTVKTILDKILESFNKQIASREISLELDEKVKAYLIDQGYSENYGARELQRVFESLISEPLAKSLLKNSIKQRDRVKACLTGENIEFIVQKGGYECTR